MEIRLKFFLLLFCEIIHIIMEKRVAFAVRTGEAAAPGKRTKEVPQTTASLILRGPKRNAMKKASSHQEGANVREASLRDHPNQDHILETFRPRTIDLNKSPPKDEDDHSLQFPILDSSSLHVQQHPLVKVHSSKMIEWSEFKKHRARKLKRERWKNMDPVERSAQAKRWRQTRKKKLHDGVSAVFY